MTHPVALLALLILLVDLLKNLAAHPTLNRLFQWLPIPFWCYTIPMMASTLGWIPVESALYPFLSQQLLPVCLALLLIGSDLTALVRLGPLATGLMLAGSFGTIVGGLVSFTLYQRWLPPETWGGIGALTASWIGGSANLLAVKEALHVPDTLIGSFVIVDALIAYSWMALLIWASGFQDRWDRRVYRHGGTGPCAGGFPERTSAGRAGMVPALICGYPDSVQISAGERGRGQSESATLGRTNDARREPPAQGAHRSRGVPRGLIAGTILAVALSLSAQWISRRLPPIEPMVTATTWTVLLVTAMALGLSLTPLRRLEEAGASRIGTFALYVLLTSIGARANLKAVVDVPVFLALGIGWILIHGGILFLAGYLLKAPLGLIATASQANIGGPISAPIVGATYHPRLAGVGLLMAILGNLLGTFLGLLTAFLAQGI